MNLFDNFFVRTLAIFMFITIVLFILSGLVMLAAAHPVAGFFLGILLISIFLSWIVD